MILRLKLFSFFLTLLNVFICSDCQLVVQTNSGIVKGVSINSNINAWLGIPFAEKPLNDLRFKRPVAVKNWSGEYNASSLPNICPQNPLYLNPGEQTNEDCLYLNIWAPNPLPKNSAVLFWIYGGGFNFGTSTIDDYNPEKIVSENQVVFVSIQYRVSIFGFLYLNNDNAPGNMGLLDQQLALKWVNENIKYFGGDPNKITIFGESAGSASVSYHLLSDISSKLFNNAILESGTALAPWAYLNSNDGLAINKKILNKIGCNKNTEGKLFDCVNSQNSKELIQKLSEFSPLEIFAPVLDKYFIKDEPINLLKTENFKKCPILIGVNKNEGSMFVSPTAPELSSFETPKLNYTTFLRLLDNLFQSYPNSLYKASSQFINALNYRYSNWDGLNNYESNVENLCHSLGDSFFVSPSIVFADYYSKYNQDTYFYHYTHFSSKNNQSKWLGVQHYAEIEFVFGRPLRTNLNYPTQEVEFSKKLLKYWSNFAKYNNPNGVQVDSSLENWPKYTINTNISDNNNQRAHLNLNANKIQINYNLRSEYSSFWSDYVPTLNKATSLTVCKNLILLLIINFCILNVRFF